MRGLVLFLIGMAGLCFVHADPPTPSTSKDKDELGNALRVACWNGDLAKATELVNKGAPLEGRDYLGRTPLFLACHGDPDVVKFLLAHGARVDAVDNNGNTTMGHACEFGDVASAQMLLHAGADLNQVNNFGLTPLMLAARTGHDASVSFLINQHVDLNVTCKYGTALSYAVSENYLSTAKVLLDAGAQVTCSPGPGDPSYNFLTIMARAALTGNTSLIDLLLAHGAQVNERNRLGISALLQAAIEVHDPAILEYLLQRGADPNLADNTGQTPFMAVVENQDIPTLRLFLQHGAKLEARDDEGRTALIHAARITAEAQVRELILQKADINAADNHGDTPLAYAGDRGNTRLVNLLKEAGATPIDLHIIPKETANPPLSASRRWALAVGALYAQWNGESHGMLGEERSEGSSRRMLKDEWEIKDRATLIGTINKLAQGPTYTRIIGEQIQDSLSFPGIEPKLVRAFQLIFLDAWWREKTNVAWDYCRAANLVRAGVDAGFIREDEAWPLLMPIARKTQKTFHSWREMSDNFLDSREIDENERSGDLRACARLLLNPKDPNSPWNQLPWQTDLSVN